MIEVLIPGSRDVVHRKVKEEDKHRFKRQYDAFVASSAEQVQGTPINQFPFISAGQRRELEYLNIFTGEQLVNMPDGLIDRIGAGGRELIKKVKAFMEVAKDSAVAVALAEKNERLEQEMKLLKDQMALLLKRQEELQDSKKVRKSHETAAHAA